MKRQQLRIPDAARSDLRAAVTAVDCEMFHIQHAGGGQSQERADQLHENWRKLVKLLDLGLEPEYRKCPFCHNTGMRLATRCGFCWTKLSPAISN